MDKRKIINKHQTYRNVESDIDLKHTFLELHRRR